MSSARDYPPTMTIGQVATLAKRPKKSVWRRLKSIDADTGGKLLKKRRPGVSGTPTDVDIPTLLENWPSIFDKRNGVDVDSDALRGEFVAMRDDIEGHDETLRDQQNQIRDLRNLVRTLEVVCQKACHATRSPT